MSVASSFVEMAAEVHVQGVVYRRCGLPLEIPCLVFIVLGRQLCFTVVFVLVKRAVSFLTNNC